jgi:hypothetical protein
MFEGDTPDKCGGKFPLTSMGGRAEGLACAELGARTHIDVSGNSLSIHLKVIEWLTVNRKSYMR